MNKTCYNCGAPISKETCEDFPEVCDAWKPKPPQTNGDRIRKMNDDELADEYIRIYNMLGWWTDSWCWLRIWLKSPVEDSHEP